MERKERRGEVNAEGEKRERKGQWEWDKESEGSGWKRFRDVSASFKSYSRTNKLALFSRLRSCPTYSQLVAMVGWAAHSNRRRRSAAVRLTVETVGIRLSVPLSVWWLFWWGERAARPHRQADAASVCCQPQLLVSDRGFGDDPHIPVETQTVLVNGLHVYSTVLRTKCVGNNALCTQSIIQTHINRWLLSMQGAARPIGNMPKDPTLERDLNPQPFAFWTTRSTTWARDTSISFWNCFGVTSATSATDPYQSDDLQIPLYLLYQDGQVES